MKLRGRWRRVPALCCFALLANAPLGARAGDCGGDAGGIGGTGVQPSAPAPKPGKSGKDRGGVGGTGRRERDRGGIGGTGVSEKDRGGIGGTGIVGVITGFGSVCVNGLEVAYDDTSRVDADGAPIQAGALAVGQVVVIDAAPRDGGLWADRLEVRNAAVGPVAYADLGRGEIDVLGQRVRIDPATRLVGGGGAAADLGSFPPGTFVAVSGLRRADGIVAATRIETTPPRDRVSVSGPLASNGHGGAAIGGLTIFSTASDAPAVAAGRATFASGRIDAEGALRADRIEPVANFAPAPARLSIEAYVQTLSRGGFRTDIVDVDASRLGANAAVAARDTRVVVSGPVGPDGHLMAERVEVVTPEPPSPSGAAVLDKERQGRADAATAAEAAGGARPASNAPGQIPAGAIEPHEAGATPETPSTPEHVDPPEVEHPETPEVPEVEKPEVPEVEHPETPEVERPEVPEVEKPETPEVERPEVPEVQRPETPEVQRPELPEVEKPETPERPEVPEVQKPEVPERPEVPEVQKPEVPERPEPVARPEVPELQRPETPQRVEVPEVEKPEKPEIQRPETH